MSRTLTRHEMDSSLDRYSRQIRFYGIGDRPASDDGYDYRYVVMPMRL